MAEKILSVFIDDQAILGHLIFMRHFIWLQ